MALASTIFTPPTEPILQPTADSAAAFAARWYSAWNANDLEAIMACYEPTVQHSSPFIKKYNAVDDAWLIGSDAVRDYFRRALERNTNPRLRFDPLHTAVGLFSITLVYRRMTGDLATELFILSERSRILRSISHYG